VWLALQLRGLERAVEKPVVDEFVFANLPLPVAV